MRSDARTILGAISVGAPREACEALVARAVTASEILPAPREDVAFRVFWADPSGDLAFADLALDDHLVIGRHSSCDVRLSDPAVALRHVLLRVRREESPAGGPYRAIDRVSLLAHDLLTEHGFRVGLAQALSRAATVEGPTVLTISMHLLVVLPARARPIEAQTADESSLRPRVVDADPALARPIASSRSELAVRTQMDLMSKTIVRPHHDTLPVEILPPSETPFARLAMRGPSGRVVVSVGASDLEAPVLVGRYPRCRRGELAPFSERVSRVHAAIVREGESVRVIDLGSTNGLSTQTREGTSIRARAIRVTSRASIALGNRHDRLDVEILGP
ncbi:MAG: FHA domain-containing protein [Deltaproteobacteria bacterium]|nr:FHA domain-containing protein [Deltaproteobacteria bacterium]